MTSRIVIFLVCFCLIACESNEEKIKRELYEKLSSFIECDSGEIGYLKWYGVDGCPYYKDLRKALYLQAIDQAYDKAYNLNLNKEETDLLSNQFLINWLDMQLIEDAKSHLIYLKLKK